MLLNNQEITEEIKEEIKNYLETNDNKNTMIQNLWDAAKAVLKFLELFISLTRVTWLLVEKAYQILSFFFFFL